LSSALLESYAASQNLFPTEVFSRKAVYISSHRSAVKSISFLPSNVEFDKKNVGQFLERAATTEPNSDQFLSLSEDGQLLFWDLNFADAKGTKTTKIGDSDLKKFIWKSLFSVQTFRTEQHLLPAAILLEQRDPTTEATLATDEGELFRVNYNFKDISGEELLNKSEFAKKIVGSPQKLLLTSAQVNPMIPNLLLMSNEVSFSLFVNTCPHPLFTSAPTVGTRITCVRFSTNRPAVIYVGKDDGTIDAWDLLDHAGTPSQQHLVSAVGVSCIETSAQRTNVLAVGDKDGCLHLLQLPKSLCKPINGEEASMQRFVEKELRRIHYYQTKFVDVENEAKRNKEAENAADPSNSPDKPTKDEPKVFGGGKSEEDALEEGFNAFLEENMLKVAANSEIVETKDK
jgi:WD40 repeat protein